jgi:hypothetical protein
MDRLDIPASEYDDPPVHIETLGIENKTVRFKATNTNTGKSVVMEFDSLG